MSKTSIRNFGSLLWAIAIDYKENYKGLLKEKEDKLKYIKDNNIPNSDSYKKGMAEAENTFNEKVKLARQESIRLCSEYAEELRDYERTRVLKVNETKLAKIRAIQDMALSEDEIVAFAEHYDVYEDYWASRLLTEIAQKNGVDGFNGAMESNYSVKLGIINELTNQLREIIEKYPSIDKEEQLRLERVNLTEPVLERAYMKYEGRVMAQDSKVAADKAWSALLSKPTDIERGVYLGNLLKNSKGEMREEILAKSKMQAGKTIRHDAILFSGYDEEIMSFNTDDYFKSKEVVEQIIDTKDENKRKEIISIYNGNEFLARQLQRASQKNNDSSLQDAALYAAGINDDTELEKSVKEFSDALVNQSNFQE